MSILTSAKREAMPGSECRAHVGVEIQALAQGHVDAGEAASDGRGDGAFEADAGAVQAIDDAFGSDWPVLRMSAALSSAISQSMATPVASTARRAAWETSGPMPSPGMRVTRCGIYLPCSETQTVCQFVTTEMGGTLTAPRRPRARSPGNAGRRSWPNRRKCQAYRSLTGDIGKSGCGVPASTVAPSLTGTAISFRSAET